MGSKARLIKFYCGVSDRSEVVHLISRLFNTDGGQGSGNFNHAGRLNQVGGSAPGGGGSASKPQASGKAVASRLRNEYSSAPKAGVVDFLGGKSKAGKNDYVARAFDLGGEVRKIPESQLDKMYDHYLKVLEYNGDPGKTSKKPIFQTLRAGREEVLTGTPEENKRMEDALVEYTEGDWKNADKEVLEKYIEQCPVVFQDQLFRGIHLKKEQADRMLEELKKGVVSFGNITSWSAKRFTAGAFACNDDDNKEIGDDEVPVVFSIPARNSRTAAPVSMFSGFKEDECIMSGKASYSVVAVMRENIVTGRTTDTSKPVREGIHVVLMERGEEYDKP